ncbi:MAG: aspartate carbamoyltransferase regulatory subunit [Gammaproteobacteria bacterium]|jgi:aspartate carbamoyltransferase regulatory subunit|nr:aspartate carbamoyltransferase regulatory subunit [Gammaproteobacteria bacterium]
MSKTLSVTAIKNGCVIDHIPAGQAIAMLSLLGIAKSNFQVTVGINLPSHRSGLKDIIKIEGRDLNEQEINEIGVLAPGATINSIKNSEVIKKVVASLPKTVSGLLHCPNSQCITHSESVKSSFHVQAVGPKVELKCHYCESSFLKPLQAAPFAKSL